ncbi:serine--tRNA ligase [Candidatus Falkowbacteria bacterium CG11_big_fil_rev_8_21_14_0_20_39_10]|uniref:Serine--tRNA ligase n=1 Tax=Candidatus Falkowbacteria bacterium CG11_big_fil_rev_8_21_14_0_20_39_10 TaxID=1974570 RepID=A0A2M6K8N2_9BACT|nr:MAG: serine--tRNA ligase [Candidatus Falkowbacteria bacterium CG11_big_fil_rev_8_21_14_0_20_39_10]
MLDIKYIRENAVKIKEAAKNKNIKLDLDKLLKLDDKRKELQTEIDQLRAKRNELAKAAKGEKPTKEQIKQGKTIKTEIQDLEKKFKKSDDEYAAMMVIVPTITAKDVPIGKDETENVEIFRSQDPPKFDFPIKSHIELGRDLDIIDFDRGVKISGYRGYFLKNEGVSLAMAIMMHALNKLIAKGFKPMIPPTLVREFVLFGSGYFSGQEFNPAKDEIYKIENIEKEADGKVNKENRFLVGTAEPSLLAYYANEVLEEKDLPIKICGYSQCYRSEIGSYGKDTAGLYRVHEFMKIEQVCLAKADIKEADKLHQEMLAISKELHEDLELPYRVLQICTGDMSAGKYKMFDLEAWIPSQKRWGETGSASNFVDWQARRLKVRYKDKQGKVQPVFMLNNTALATPRTIISILENHQQKDGSVLVPKVLRKWMPGEVKVIKRK